MILRFDNTAAMTLRPALTLAAVLASISTALAGSADVIDATATKAPDGTYTFSVTIKSDDTGWEKYADRWEVLSPDGEVLGVRVLAHPHQDEQPFTRDLSGVKVPPHVTQVMIRAHDKVEGFGGKTLEVMLPIK